MTKTHVPKPRPMNLSNIGYKGVGSDGKAMGWYYGWNPGGFGCSKNCDGCWSKAMARRINGTGRPFCKACANFEVHFHEERLNQPELTKRGGVVLTDFCSDIADPARGMGYLPRMWDIMWSCPQHTFVLLTKQHMRLAKWIVSHASHCSFGWTAVERRPIECGEYQHMTDIRMRNECGYVGDNEDRHWCCLHPKNDGCGTDNSCDSRNCPLARPADSRDQLREIGLEAEYDFDADGYAEDSEWMQWFARPHHAAASNVWLGFTARNQRELATAVKAIALIKGNNPYAKTWLSLEPLESGLDFTMNMHPDIKLVPGEQPTLCNWLERRIEMQHGSETTYVPYIDGIIVGHDNRRNAKGADTLSHVRDVVKQCQGANTPVFVKQVWHMICPRCKRWIDEGSTCSKHPKATAKWLLCKTQLELQQDLRHRQLPWSMPTKEQDK